MKEKWFFEEALPNANQDFKIGFRVKKRIFFSRSKYQKIEILDTFGLGRILVLDGIIQLSQKYEFIYHEMLAHLALFSHPNPKEVLIIGGGDGGILREVLKHPIEKIHLVEIDGKIIELSKKYLPFLGLRKSLKDKRVSLVFQDGTKFLRNFRNFFDVIIVDSTDPSGPSLPLFQKKFYQNAFSSLKRKGIFITQSGNFFDQALEIKQVSKKLESIFDYVKIYHFFTPDYQNSDFSLSMGSKKINLEKINFRKIDKRFKEIRGLKYYSPQVHFASGIMSKFWINKLNLD